MEAVRQELGLGVNRFLRLAGIAKATYYRRKRGVKPRPCPAQHKIAQQVGEHLQRQPRYGYRKIWALLARQGITTSPSTVYRLMKRGQRQQKSPRRKGPRYTPRPG